MRLLGLVSIAVIVVAAAVPLLGKPLDWQDSVSHSWAGSARKQQVMAVVMSLAGTGICTSLALWVIPRYHLPAFMYGVILAAYLAFLGVALVPMTERPGEHSFWHWHFLGGSSLATLAIVAMGTVAMFGTTVSLETRIVCFVAMVFAAGWPLLFFTRARRIFLALESLIAVTFSVAIILLLRG